ncbi:MAG: hypothetical protein V1917_03815 [Candidatus Gottesmanbacteria bacterium]
MSYSRLRKFEEHRQERKIVGALVGIFAIFIFLAFFGIKILTGFSLFVDNIRGGTTTQQVQQLILPPELDPLPIATNSASITVTGKGTADLTVILYINDMDTKKMTVDKDGTFKFEHVPLAEGTNTLSAKLTDDKKNISDLSEVITVTIKKTKPTLEITTPHDGDEIRGEQNLVTVSGKTEDTNSVTVNGRVVVMKADGSFFYDYPLGEGDTTLQIVATDLAGNQTKVERKVKYTK